MSEESPAASAVTANAEDSRPEAAEPNPAPASNEALAGQEAEKPSAGEAQAEEQTKTADTGAAEVNGKDTDTAGAQDANGGTPSAKNAASRRKSTGGGGASAKKQSKKQQRPTHLDAQPGDYYLARWKKYPPWPSIICDEEMLPQSLLNSRPVTTKQADGTYREDYADGGKRAHDRTFPIMFLETNEFAWIPNTDLSTLDPESCKNVSEKGKQKQLIAAYKVAAEGHDLQYFKNLLADHQRAVQQEFADREAAAAEKAALKAQKEAAKEAAREEKERKKKEDKEKAKKTKRKSTAAEAEAGEADGDEAGKKAKATKKRKKDAESDAEGSKPKKTPKTATKLKLTTPKDPNASAKKPSTKSKKAAKDTSDEGEQEEEEADKGDSDEEQENESGKTPSPEAPKIDPQVAKERKKKEILFIRHRLQKGFLSREEAPKEEEMETMADFFSRLESYGEIEVSIIRETKIQKVLRAILKLSSIPKDELYHFKKRAVDILSSWKNLLDSDLPPKQTPAKTNGADNEAASSANPNAESEAKEEPKEAPKEGVEPAEDKDEPMPDADSGEQDKPTSAEKPKEESGPAAASA